MQNIFFNHEENRPRAFWRITITTILIFSLVIVASFFLRGFILLTIGLAILVLFVMYVVAEHVDKRNFSDFGFTLNRSWIADFLAGNLMAAMAMAGTSLFLVLLGFADISFHLSDFSGMFFLNSVGVMGVFFLAVSVWEEAFFRGYLITNIKEGFHFKWLSKEQAVHIAVLSSSVIFGISHSANPGSSLLALVNITVAGIILAWPYIKTKSLAISVGMHLSWNYFQGVVFGFPVSGIDSNHTFATTIVSGPEWITGGQFGPEGGAAGLIGLMLLAATCQLYLAWFYKK